MKTLVVLLSIALAHSAFAKEGGDHAGNGGDICEMRIKEVRDDIKLWIQGGGARALQLPAPIDMNLYELGMIDAIEDTSISCTDRELEVNGALKTCVNVQTGTGPQLACNISRFSSTSQSDQYVLIHHEYAGVAGFETNNGSPESNYQISNQITGFLENTVVKKLVVKSSPSSSQAFDPKSCVGPAITQQEVLQKFEPGTSLSKSFGNSKLYQRSRTCNKFTGCAPWIERKPVGYLGATSTTSWKVVSVDLSIMQDPAIQFFINGQSIMITVMYPNLSSAQCSWREDGVLYCGQVLNAGHPVYADHDLRGPISITGVLTNKCFRMSGTTTVENPNSSYVEYETVMLGRL